MTSNYKFTQVIKACQPHTSPTPPTCFETCDLDLTFQGQGRRKVIVEMDWSYIISYLLLIVTIEASPEASFLSYRQLKHIIECSDIWRYTDLRHFEYEFHHLLSRYRDVYLVPTTKILSHWLQYFLRYWKIQVSSYGPHHPVLKVGQSTAMPKGTSRAYKD